MARQSFGTNAFTSLNVGTAPHLIDPHELTESVDGWTSQTGKWSTAPGPSSLYTGSAITAMAKGRMGGADHVVYVDGTTLYDNGSSAGTVASGVVRVVPVDDAFLLLGASKAYIYDGDHVREFGPLQPDNGGATYASYFSVNVGSTTSASITGITVDTPAANQSRITCGLQPAAGERVYITGITTGPTELNGNVFTVIGTPTATYFDIDVDTSDLTAWSAGGTAYLNACGLTGDYKFYATTTLELADGTILESRPRGITSVSGESYKTTWEPKTYTLSPTDALAFSGRLYWLDGSGDAYYEISGTRGTDYTPGMRLYRTKAGGTDFYLEKEFEHGDSDFGYFGSNPTYYAPAYAPTKADRDLGAVYLPGLNDHDTPPAATLAALAGQRLVINDPDNPKRIHWSGLDGIDYFGTFDWTPIKDTITAIASWNESAILFSGDRMWELSFPGGAPYLREIPTKVGTTYPDAVFTDDDGVQFLRDDGLWVYGGGPVIPISDAAFSSITTPTCAASTGTMKYVAGSAKAYVAVLINGKWEWHETSSVYDFAHGSGDTIVAASTTEVYTLFNGGYGGGTMTTKQWRLPRDARSVTAYIDCEGPSAPTVYVNGNRESDTEARTTSGPDDDGRRLVEVPVPQLVNHLFSLTVEATGECHVYGVELEVES